MNKPKKKLKPTTGFDIPAQIHRADGYNQCIDDYEKFIDEAPIERTITRTIPEFTWDKYGNTIYSKGSPAWEEAIKRIAKAIRKLLKG